MTMKKITIKTSFLFLFSLLMILWQMPKANAQVTFNGDFQSAPIAVCNGTSQPLEVGFTVTQATSTNHVIKVSVALADGIEYAGDLQIVSSSPTGVTFGIVEDDVSDPKNPKFEIKHTDGSPIALAEGVVFSFKRKATCTAYTNALNADETGFKFKDNVTVTIDDASTSQESLPYNVVYPNFVLTPPATTNNADLGEMITRSYTLTNAGATSANKVFLSIDYGNAVYLQDPNAATLKMGTTTLTPTSTSGSKATYELSGAALGDDNLLTNGEVLTLTETFKLKTCSPSMTYTAGWGCDAENLCQEEEKGSKVTMAAGTPNFGGITEATRIDYVNMCTDYKMKLTYKNTGTGTSMGAMYDVDLIFTARTNDHKGFTLHSFSEIKLSGQSVSNSFTTDPGFAGVEVKTAGLFSTDPDGPGVGLEDLDGDGKFDDLPAGASVDLEFKVHIKNETEPGCGDNVYESTPVSKVKYHTACDPEEKTLTKDEKHDVMGYYNRTTLGDASYTPQNIEAGTPFEGRIALSYNGLRNFYRSDNTRFVTKITLPTGMTLSNIKWVKGNFPSLETPVAADYTQVGNVITVVSPSRDIGYITFDAQYACQATNTDVAISYKMHEVSDYINHPDCYSFGKNLLCGTRNVTVLGCPEEECTEGVATGLPVIEREDNSLGWKDATLTELQDRSAIPAYDLAKAMYKDEFRVEANATQHGAATNLFAHLEIAQDEENENGLEVLTADIIITRGDEEKVNATNLNGLAVVSSNGGKQIIDWDFTSVLPAGGLQDGDKIKITTRYRVESENYPLRDENAGKTWYIYNQDAANGHKKCNTLIPEIYLMGSYLINGTNSYNLKACEKVNLAGNIAHLARRFKTGGLRYQNEYRPSMRVKKAYIEVPKSLKVNNVQWLRVRPHSGYETLTPSITDMGTYNLIECEIPEDLQYSSIAVQNSYDVYLRMNVTPSCAVDEDVLTDKVKTYFDFTDYYYHSKNLEDASAFEMSKGLESDEFLKYSKKPKIELSNQTGVVELSGKTGEWTVRYNNASQVTAPYNWLAIPTKDDLTITKVTRLSDNTVISATPYAGGNMYHLSDEGVASGGALDYKIEFEYTGCTNLALTVYGGWNCSAYPATLEDYDICEDSKKEVVLEARPLNTLVENYPKILPPTNPKPDLCTELDYVYQIQSSDAANLYDVVFQIVPVEGLTVVNGSVKVEYPTGSNDWQSVSSNFNNGVYNVKVLDHPALATLGYLPGTNEAANNGERQVNVKFTMMTDCDFTSGKNFNVKTAAKNSCDQWVKGSRVPFSTPVIKIEGADPTYLMVTELDWKDGVPGGANCKEAKTIHVKEIISADNGIVTGNQGKIEILIPKGFEYAGTYNPISADAPDASTLNTEDLPSGEQKLTLAIPAGLATGTVMEYEFNIQEDNSGNAVCGEVNIQVSALDVITGLTCGTTTCPNSNAVTGVGNLAFELEKADITISTLSASSVYGSSGENISVEYKVENSADIALAVGTTITLFDDKNDNDVYNDGDVIVATQTTTADVTKTTPFTGTFTATGVDPANLCDLKISILPADGCFCSIQPANVNITGSPALAGDDIEVCAGDTEQIGVASTGYTSYAWSSTEAEATAYLSATDVAQPNFTYNGPVLETERTFTYTLTVTRPGGCTFTDKINVTVKSHDVCFVKAYNDINQTPEGVSVSGDVSTNDENIVDTNPIVSAEYYDASGAPQNLPLGTATTVYGDNGAEAGTMTLNSDGTYTFEPKAGFTGDVPFTYVAKNANGVTDSATLDIKVIPHHGSGNNPPIAQDDTHTVEQGQTATVPILDNDSDPDGDNLTVKEVKGLNSNGQPTVNLDDTDKEVYVEDPNNPGTYIKAGTAKLVNDKIEFTPEAGFTGDVPFDYTISDNGTLDEGHTDTATATITVLPINGANSVFANDDANTGKQGEPLTGNVTKNDSDPENNTFTVTKIDTNGDGTPNAVPGTDMPITKNGKELGKLTIAADGSYTWKPAPDFVGTVVIPYEITDQPNNGSPAKDVATLYLTALPSNCGFLRSNRNVTRQLIK